VARIEKQRKPSCHLPFACITHQARPQLVDVALTALEPLLGLQAQSSLLRSLLFRGLDAQPELSRISGQLVQTTSPGSAELVQNDVDGKCQHCSDDDSDENADTPSCKCRVVN
jgi:hypothetical protein